MKLIVLILFMFSTYVTFIRCGVSTSGLEIVSDDDLVETIKVDNLVIVLFSKPNCQECDALETQLFNLRNDFEENLQAKVIKVLNSQLVRLHSSTKEPSIVFFRHGVPLLYDGSANEEEIYQKFDENRVPVVKELSDENFEHLTQASSGATTGDWFILFYNRECIECQRLTAVWEAVGAATRNRLNVARIDKDLHGINTAKRFKVQKAPEFIFIRLGNFYRYEIPKLDVKSFVSFANEWYKNSRAEKITVAPSPFDDLVSASVAFIKEIQAKGINTLISDTRYIVAIAFIAFSFLAIIAIKCIFRSNKTINKDKKKKSK